jgi:hypothetical protein
MGKAENLTGQRFGMLIVLYRSQDKVQPSGQKKSCGTANANVVMKKIFPHIVSRVEVRILVGVIENLELRHLAQ